MSKRRISNSQNKSRGSVPPVGPFNRYLGISLSAGRAEKTALTVLDHYVKEDRLFLSHLIDRIQTEKFISADSKLLELVREYGKHLKSIFFDCPITLPACLVEKDAQAELEWITREFEKLSEKKRPKKNLTPYTQRSADFYFANEMKAAFEVHHALGANLAPLTARATYLRPQLAADVFETNTKIVVWRVGHELGLRRSHLKNHRSAVLGQATRREFLKALVTKINLFIYEQDLKILIDHAPAFDSLVSALMGFWHSQGLAEIPPPGFPSKAAWVQTPLAQGIFPRQDE